MPKIFVKVLMHYSFSEVTYMFFTEELAGNLNLCAQWLQEGAVDAVWHLYSARRRPCVSLGINNEPEIFLAKGRHFI